MSEKRKETPDFFWENWYIIHCDFLYQMKALFCLILPSIVYRVFFLHESVFAWASFPSVPIVAPYSP